MDIVVVIPKVPHDHDAVVLRVEGAVVGLVAEAVVYDELEGKHVYSGKYSVRIRTTDSWVLILDSCCDTQVEGVDRAKWMLENNRTCTEWQEYLESQTAAGQSLQVRTVNVAD